MAINNAEAVKFSNEKARVFADSMVTAYETATKFKAQYDAQGLDTVFPNTSEVVEDGSSTDGRTPMTGQKIRALYTAATDLISWGDTVIAGKTRIIWLRTMHVNGQSRF